MYAGSASAPARRTCFVDSDSPSAGAIKPRNGVSAWQSAPSSDRVSVGRAARADRLSGCGVPLGSSSHTDRLTGGSPHDDLSADRSLRGDRPSEGHDEGAPDSVWKAAHALAAASAARPTGTRPPAALMGMPYRPPARQAGVTLLHPN
jgi:hypothetical protein